MQTLAILLVLLGFCSASNPARAEQQSNDCKLCGELQRACAKNHSQAACKTEYEICMKHCRRK